MKNYAKKGGKRENSGRKYKYEEYGQNSPLITVKMPEQIPLNKFEQFVKDFLIENQQQFS